mmetsp:Transcript_47297/g.101854  ORF Transcript_47297/g.101854 Transcript_47297/m.101854 type:complete len:800 (+) Transcript_47297:91-2490(+)
MILSTSKNTLGRNASATLAFHAYRKTHDGEEDGGDQPPVVQLMVENVDIAFRAKLHVEVVHNLSVTGPRRHIRSEAICDAMELGRAYLAGSTEQVRKVARRLDVTRWSPQDLAKADEQALEKLCRTKPQNTAVTQKLIPPGEGWTRHDDEKLIEQRSEVYFSQIGSNAGKYFKWNAGKKKYEEVGAPHTSVESPVTLSSGSACTVRRGTKLDRAVTLNDIAKIARLALKFPLSFVDTPACAYAVFQGLRSAESAQWCAENFHKKLLPIIAEKIHSYEDDELEKVLVRTLETLDGELLLSAHAFSGCTAMIALVLGRRLVVAGIGSVRAVLLPEKGKAKPLLELGAGSLECPEELARLRNMSGAVLQNGLLHFSSCAPPPVAPAAAAAAAGQEGHETAVVEEDLAEKILSARHVFEVFELDTSNPIDVKQIRSIYRKLALKVHPDKIPEGGDPVLYKMAFSRLDTAKDALEAMLSEDVASCRELHRILSCDVRTRSGAAALLGTDDAEAAEKRAKAKAATFEKLHRVAPDFERGQAVCREAVATLRRTSNVEVLPRQDALMKEGISSSRAMGARDLRFPYPLVQMRPEAMSRLIPPGRCRVALLTGATAALSDDELLSSTKGLDRQPKASALRWCLNADSKAACTSALCIQTDMASGPTDTPAAKRQRTNGGSSPTASAATVRVRHILFAHQQLRQSDMMARRIGKSKTVQEAEVLALEVLEKLLAPAASRDQQAFPKLCREHSDCQSAAQPGALSGDLGWVSRGQQEAAFEEACFNLAPQSYSDLITTSRGIHIIHRLA